jgi:flagellar biosynthesis anti-sigma factor FlgM
MRIGDVQSPPVNPAGGPAGEKRAGEGERSSADDAVTLSNLSRAVSESSVSDARIEQLRELVKTGKYEVPAAKLAGKIVDFDAR